MSKDLELVWSEDECTRGLPGHEYLRDAFFRLYNKYFDPLWNSEKAKATEADYGDCFQREVLPGIICEYSCEGGAIYKRKFLLRKNTVKYTVHVHHESGSAWINNYWEGEGHDGCVSPMLMNVSLQEANEKLNEYEREGYTVHRFEEIVALRKQIVQPLQRKQPLHRIIPAKLAGEDRWTDKDSNPIEDIRRMAKLIAEAPLTPDTRIKVMEEHGHIIKELCPICENHLAMGLKLIWCSYIPCNYWRNKDDAQT